MPIAAKQIFLGGVSRPYAYEVEYLESDGTAYVDTGYTSTSKDEVLSITVDPRARVASQVVVGSFSTAPERLQLAETSLRIGANWASCSLEEYAKNYVVMDLVELCARVNGATITNGFSAPEIIEPLTLFARNNEGTIDCYANCRIYSFGIEREGNTLMAYKPVVDRAGVACFYDTISKSLVYPTVGTLTPGGKV